MSDQHNPIDDDDDEEDEDYVPGVEEDVDEEFAEEDLSDDPDKASKSRPGGITFLFKLTMSILSDSLFTTNIYLFIIIYHSNNLLERFEPKWNFRSSTRCHAHNRTTIGTIFPRRI